MLKRFFFITTLAIALALGSVVMGGGALPAQAQVDSGLGDVGETIVLPDTDPRVIATRIINVSLGLIGIILVIIIVYAGFLYMTSGGDAQKTQTALRYIRNAIIGLIIILLSWGITRFVIEGLLEATGPGGGVTTGGTGGGGTGGGGFGGSGSQPFAVVSITPSGEVTTRKVIVKLLFNRTVSEASSQAAGNIVVENASGTEVPVTMVASGRVVTVTPTTPCPAPNEDRRCFDENADYTVRVSGSLESAAGDRIACGGFSTSCEGTFRTGTEVDVTPPLVTLTYPVNGQGVPGDSLVDVSAYVQDQTGVSYVSFAAASAAAGTSVIGEAAPTPGTRSPSQFDARTLWDTAGLAPGSQHSLAATAYDIDSGVATSEAVTVTIRAASCFDGVQNGNETGLDCGGDPSAPDYCGACSGGACSNGNQCASGVCGAGQCVEQPVITSVTPLEGAPGTFVTIRGVNFGQNGQVVFLGTPDGTGVLAPPPETCRAAGVSTWNPSQVIVQVPAGAQSGAIQVTNNVSGLSDSTNAPPNPFINDFLVNDVTTPGICAIQPDEGEPGDRFELIGSGFGNTPATILFGSRTLSSTSWSDERAEAIAPNVTPGGYPVGIQVADRVSNPVQFKITSRESTGATPEITNIDPPSGPVGAYVTLTGTEFGRTTGQVFFRDIATGNEALADTTFPPMCSGGFWKTDAVVVKVPAAFTLGSTGALQPGAYAVRVVTAAAGGPESNEVNFAVNTDPATPGICAVIPSVAPVGSTVTLYGERFTSNAGTVTFYQNREGTVDSWANTQVSVAIPTGARSGPVTLAAAGGPTSNQVLLEVQSCTQAPEVCQNGEVCCADGTCRAAGSCSAAADRAMFAWRTSTGLIPRAPRVVEECQAGDVPSPSPWLNRTGGDDACVNATVALRFTSQIDPTSVAPGSGAIQIFACTGNGSDPCDEHELVPLATGFPTLAPANAMEDYVQLAPLAPFAPGTLYEVVVRTAVRGAGESGINMPEDAGRCGQGNAYCFRFQTRNDISPCSLGGVQVTPSSFTATEQGPLDREHQAMPLAANDACVILQCQDFDWEWSASDGRASVTNDRDLSRSPSLGACRQTVTANAETGEDPVVIQAATLGTRGTADLYVKFIPPVVERYGPNCDDACVNALVWAVTNVELDDATVTPENVLIQACNNENCAEPEEPGFSPSAEQIRVVAPNDTTDSRKRQINIIPLQNGTLFLEEGRFYKVTLKGGTETGIRSLSGVPLAGLNGPEGFSWVFRVRQGEQALCQVDRIGLAPREKYETQIGARQAFVATPVSSPDACSESGQQLIPENLSWASSDTNVAVLINGGVIDTGPVPAGCSGQCTFMGAAGRDGQVARCGNGRVETTNARYCVNGATAQGNRPCILLGAGGSGGEECDDGNDDNTDACSNSCLWNPVPSVLEGGTCGNGTRDTGEDCDFGSTCQGPLLPGARLSPGDDCTSQDRAAQCAADGGVCIPGTVRGCSPSCRNLGSVAGDATCGNGDLGDGEDCDDGNRTSGDGCSVACLHEGSSRNIYASCGNGTREPGEACEKNLDDTWPAGCNQSTCLNEGTPTCVIDGEQNCCGNGGDPEEGEDCEDGNKDSGDGCSAICLSEGASAGYDAPSFCGDGLVGRGEQCDRPEAGGDGIVDPVQIAEIIGNGQVDDATGRMSTVISAALPSQDKSGQALYGLQCGFTNEQSCSEDRTSYSSEQGLTTAGCCSLRPTLLPNTSPPNGEQNTCRNARISGEFNVEMDEASLQANFLVAKRVDNVACPSGLRDVTYGHDPIPDGVRGFFVRAWRTVVAFFTPAEARAQLWCAGTVAGRLETETTSVGTTIFSFTLNAALEPFTEYQVRFLPDTSNEGDPDVPHPLADNENPAMRTGIKSKQGVVAWVPEGGESTLSWSFTTGQEICTVNQVVVRDTNRVQPNFISAADDIHVFEASAISLRNGRPSFISPIPDVYAWEWDNWAFSRPALIDIQPPTLADDERVASVTTRELASKGVNGTGFLSARVRVTTDTVNEPSTVGRPAVQGTESVTVNLCENPWPSFADAPFRDEEGSPSLENTPFDQGPFFNFSVGYCRDAGATGPNEDLPALVPSIAAPNALDAEQGILRQYLFTFREPELQKDAIGIRIAANPGHLSPLDWYRSKGFTGNPQAMEVDGFEAIRDGRTVYVSAVNTDGPGTDMYSNIYLISYNDGAEPITRQLYDALLDSFAFITNIQTDVANACQTPNGSLVLDGAGLPIHCEIDNECYAFGTGVRCANFKGKIQRDMVRLADFQTLTTSLLETRNTQGNFPALRTGSFLPGFTTSRWPSWNDTFRAALGGRSTAVAEDPVNRFATCGRCAGSQTACVADADCQNGEACVTDRGFDPATCWSAQNEQFLCPNDEQGSRVYQYRALAGGGQFELAAEFEVPPPNRFNLTESWWKPAPPEVLSQGGQFRYTNVCVGEVAAASGSCGDGIVNTGEVCELTGPTATRQVDCRAANDKFGMQQQRCFDCTRYVTDSDQPGCFANEECGNGRVDEGEACDDGAENGRYGRCDLTCSGYGAFCGDGQRSVGEICDNGTGNTDYCAAGSCDFTTACNLTCSGQPAYCGNSRVDVGEECDGPVRSTEGCQPGFIKTRACTSACRLEAWGECEEAGSCGDGIPGNSEIAPGVLEECDDADNDNTDACTNTCRRNVCGDAIPFVGVEECDLGPNNGKACQSAEYGSTCASCSLSCKFQLTQGGYCGDGIRSVNSGEQCDRSDFGGSVPSCQALGFDYLKAERLQCTDTCQLSGCGYCGEEPGDGQAEGIVFDTLFQQPIPGARVSLYYRGLLVDQKQTDAKGYFLFAALDNHQACSQYRLVVDSYRDNPLTLNMNEETRGGYQPVEIQAFRPSNSALLSAVTQAGKGVAVTGPNGGDIAQINMLPQLGENEYVVQLWWNPSGGYSNLQEAFKEAVFQNGTVNQAAADAFYAGKENEYHDLVVRVPNPYVPGDTPQSCQLSPLPERYQPNQGDGRNAGKTSSNGTITEDPEERPGKTGVDHADSNTGMLSCTNKVRATASHTCSGASVPESLIGRIPCTPDDDEEDNACRDRYGFDEVDCAGPAEASRSGNITALEGQPGAYLFCFHPEWHGIDENRAASADCTNFILPPQSVFINGRGGQYDILVSKYRLFASTSHSYQGADGNRYTNRFSIREWLWNRRAEIRIYDKGGLRETIAFRDADENATGNARTQNWAAWDGGYACLTQETRENLQDDWTALKGAIEWLDTVSYSPVWTPVSIDTTARAVNIWNGGYAGADYRYFADLLHRTHRLYRGANTPGCVEETCDNAGGIAHCTGTGGGSSNR